MPEKAHLRTERALFVFLMTTDRPERALSRFRGPISSLRDPFLPEGTIPILRGPQRLVFGEGVHWPLWRFPPKTKSCDRPCEGLSRQPGPMHPN